MPADNSTPSSFLMRYAPIAGLLLLMIFGAALRLPGMASALAPDEQFSYDEYIRPGLERMLLMRYQCNNQPLSSLATWATTSLWGDSDIVFRIPAFLTGMLLFPVVFLFGRRAFGSPVPALLAVLVLALHMYHIAYSSNFRSYAFVTLFATLTAWQLAEHLQGPSWKKVVGMSVSVFLMAFSHIVSMILFAGWALVLLVYAVAQWDRGTWRNRHALYAFCGGVGGIAGGFALASLAYLPSFFLPTAAVVRLLTGKWPPDAFNFVSGAEQGQWHNFSRYADTVTSMQGIPFWIAAILAVGGTWGYFRRGNMGAGVVLASLLGPVAALLIANLKIEPRYSLSLVPFFCLAMGAGISGAARRAPDFAALINLKALRIRRVLQVATAVLLTGGISYFMVYRYFENFPHSAPNFATVLWDHKAAIGYANEHAQTGDVVVSTEDVDMQFDHVADKHWRRFQGGVSQPQETKRMWLLSSPGSGAPEPYVDYPWPLVHAGSFSFCELHYMELHTQSYLPVLPFPAWKLYNYGDAPNGNLKQEGETTWFESTGGRSEASVQTDSVPCAPRRLAGFRVWVNRADVSGDIMAQLVFLDATRMPLEVRVTHEPRPVSADEEGWQLYQIEALVPKAFVSCYAEVRWRSRMETGQRVGIRGAELWLDR